jgi:hypothetical protein
VLPIAIDIFNKLQDKNYKMHKLDSYQRFEHVSQVTDIDANLNKLNYLINDHRSPVVSVLLETEHYSNMNYDDDFKAYYSRTKDIFTPLDHDHFKRDNERLHRLHKEVLDMA